MALEIFELEATFRGGSGEASLPSMSFPPLILNRRRVVGPVHVVLNSFEFEFPDSDHNLAEVDLTFDAPVARNETGRSVIQVSGRFGWRDAGNFDDPFRVFVRCLVIADTERL